jgi:hypothetical protein
MGDAAVMLQPRPFPYTAWDYLAAAMYGLGSLARQQHSEFMQEQERRRQQAMQYASLISQTIEDPEQRQKALQEILKWAEQPPSPRLTVADILLSRIRGQPVPSAAPQAQTDIASIASRYLQPRETTYMSAEEVLRAHGVDTSRLSDQEREALRGQRIRVYVPEEGKPPQPIRGDPQGLDLFTQLAGWARQTILQRAGTPLPVPLSQANPQAYGEMEARIRALEAVNPQLAATLRSMLVQAQVPTVIGPDGKPAPDPAVLTQLTNQFNAAYASAAQQAQQIITENVNAILSALRSGAITREEAVQRLNRWREAAKGLGADLAEALDLQLRSATKDLDLTKVIRVDGRAVRVPYDQYLAMHRERMAELERAAQQADLNTLERKARQYIMEGTITEDDLRAVIAAARRRIQLEEEERRRLRRQEEREARAERRAEEEHRLRMLSMRASLAATQREAEAERIYREKVLPLLRQGKIREAAEVALRNGLLELADRLNKMVGQAPGLQFQEYLGVSSIIARPLEAFLKESENLRRVVGPREASGIVGAARRLFNESVTGVRSALLGRLSKDAQRKLQEGRSLIVSTERELLDIYRNARSSQDFGRNPVALSKVLEESLSKVLDLTIWALRDDVWGLFGVDDALLARGLKPGNPSLATSIMLGYIRRNVGEDPNLPHVRAALSRLGFIQDRQGRWTIEPNSKAWDWYTALMDALARYGWSR